MPAIPPAEIVNAILDAFQDSGTPAVILSPITQHPRRFLIQSGAGNIEVWIYAWTLTHGGRPSLPDEYRIQMTTVASPLRLNVGGPTVLLGYEPNLKMFAGFDLDRHKTFSTGSPSVQVDIRCLHRGLQDGFGFDRKGNDEIAVGIRPDQITNYVANAQDLHRLGSGAAMYGLLTRASKLENIAPDELASMPKKRQRIVSAISRLSREGAFRQKVLTAYGQRCAVTRIQLRLVDAAHILPVGAHGSVDAVQNGLALSPTFHRAFDNGLIFLDESFVMRINPQKELQVVTLGQNGGLADFKRFLDRPIHLPPDAQQWPAVSLIRQANRYRRVG